MAQLATKPRPIKPDAKLENAIRAMREGHTLTAAAREARASRERLAAYAKRYAGASRQKGVWSFDDKRTRRVPIVAAGDYSSKVVKVPGFEPAHLAGLHFEEASAALLDQSLFPAFIERWANVSITDINGNTHKFSVDPNHLYRAISTEEIDWSRIYHLYMH